MIEDYIEALNRFRENKKLNGTYVLQRYIDIHPQFKAYKVYYFILWLVNSKDKIEILRIEHQDRATDEEVFKKNATILFLEKLYKYVEDGIQ